MKKGVLILLIIFVLIVGFTVSTLASPVLVVAEDASEEYGIDMAAKFSITGFEWIYPGSTFNENGQTLHNVHFDSPDDPYGAARDMMTYTYNFTPHIIISVNNAAAQAIFGEDIIDNIRANDAYNGYAGSENVQGTMSRGDAVDTAMSNGNFNIIQVPIQALMGNIKFIFV